MKGVVLGAISSGAIHEHRAAVTFEATYIYIYIYMYMHIYIYIYTYAERPEDGW